MAKEPGLADQFFIDGVDLSGDVGAVDTISARSGVLSVRGINAAGEERILAHTDGEISFTSFFNDATSQQHLTLRDKSSGADRIATWFHGSGIGETAAALVAKQINYDPTRGADGSLTIATQCLGNLYGLDYCDQLTAGKRTDTGATNGTGYNNGGATALGLSAYLHVFSFTGTSVTVAVEQSSNDGGGDPYAAILTFTAATGVTKERKVTATLTTAVEQYLRVATTGTFNPATFAVAVCRYPYAL